MDVSDDVKTIAVEKFGTKYLVWQAICQCGRRSKPYVTTGTINSQIYIKECLRQRLLPFITSHGVPTIFWPDLATCHYSAATLEWYKANNINYVPKDMNPPNCPELRPIERYWARIKSKLQKGKQTAKSLQHFRRLWTAATRKIDNSTVQSLMNSIRKKVRLFSRKYKN